MHAGVVGVRDRHVGRPERAEERALLLGHVFDGAEPLRVCDGDARDDGDVWIADLREPRDLATLARSHLDDGDAVHWLGEIDAGSLKIKVASTIVAISSIHLLQVFLNVSSYTADKLMWFTLIHLAFVVSALFLAFIDRVSAQTKSIGKVNRGDEKAAKAAES